MDHDWRAIVEKTFVKIHILDEGESRQHDRRSFSEPPPWPQPHDHQSAPILVSLRRPTPAAGAAPPQPESQATDSSLASLAPHCGFDPAAPPRDGVQGIVGDREKVTIPASALCGLEGGKQKRKPSQSERQKQRRRKAASKLQRAWRAKTGRKALAWALAAQHRALCRCVVRAALRQHLQGQAVSLLQKACRRFTARTRAEHQALCRCLLRATYQTASIDDFAHRMHRRLSFRTRGAYLEAGHARQNALNYVLRIVLVLASQLHLMQTSTTFAQVVAFTCGCAVELQAMSLSGSAAQSALVGRTDDFIATTIVLVWFLRRIMGLCPLQQGSRPHLSTIGADSSPGPPPAGPGSDSSHPPENFGSHAQSSVNTGASGSSSLHNIPAATGGINTESKMFLVGGFSPSSAPAIVDCSSQPLCQNHMSSPNSTAGRPLDAYPVDESIEQLPGFRIFEDMGSSGVRRDFPFNTHRSTELHDVEFGIPLHATLVGIDESAHDRNLTGCVSDVSGIGAVLSRLGFECHLHFNSGIEGLENAVDQHVANTVQAVSSLKANERSGCFVTVFHFAGHGATFNGHPLLCASDGKYLDLEDALMRKMDLRTGSHIKLVPLVILDTCRYCVDSGRNFDAPPPNRKIYKMFGHTPEWTIFHACDPLSGASESDSEGVFSSCLATHLKEWLSMDIFTVFTKTAADVRQRRRLQRPWIESRMPFKLRLKHPSTIEMPSSAASVDDAFFINEPLQRPSIMSIAETWHHNDERATREEVRTFFCIGAIRPRRMLLRILGALRSFCMTLRL